MGNKWYGISTEKLVQSELTLLKRGGIESKDIKIYDVPISIDQTSL